MYKNNNVYYITINNNDINNYQYRITKESNGFKIQVLRVINNQTVWEYLNIDENTNLSTINDVINYITKNNTATKNKQSIKRKTLTKAKGI